MQHRSQPLTNSEATVSTYAVPFYNNLPLLYYVCIFVSLSLFLSEVTELSRLRQPTLVEPVGKHPLMAADDLKPPGRELAGYEVCPDGVSSAPAQTPHLWLRCAQ